MPKLNQAATVRRFEIPVSPVLLRQNLGGIL